MCDTPKAPNFSVPFPILKRRPASQTRWQGTDTTDLYAPPWIYLIRQFP
jgi:hypothetical protein